MIPDMKIDLAAIAGCIHPTIQNLQREGQRFERAVMRVAVCLAKPHAEASALIVAAMPTSAGLGDAVSSLLRPSELQTRMDAPAPAVTEADPAPTCPPIGARLGRRLGVRRR